ncbi:MAG TPA: phosphoribosyltransferase [Campylobacterales bacterium]|nr:phosphoribosyltransferase [Campylobacterales bacterium]
MYYYKYEEFIDDVEFFYNSAKSYDPDIILAVARGGVTIGHFLAEKFKIRALYTLNSIHYDDTKKLDLVKVFNIPKLPAHKKVLVVDDIVDSGESFKEIMAQLENKYPKTIFKTGVIFYKKDAIFTADFNVREAHDWIEFFWTKP